MLELGLVLGFGFVDILGDGVCYTVGCFIFCVDFSVFLGYYVLYRVRGRMYFLCLKFNFFIGRVNGVL